MAELYTTPLLIPKIPLYADAFTPVPPRDTPSVPVVSESATPSELVAYPIKVLPGPPIKSDDDAIEERPVPPRVAPNCPVQPRVRFCAEILPVMLVSLVIACTTLELSLPAASVPVHAGVKVKAPAVLVMLNWRLVSDDVANVIAPVCAEPPPSCWSERRPLFEMVTLPVAPETLIPVPAMFERTPVLVTLPAEYARPDE